MNVRRTTLGLIALILGAFLVTLLSQGIWTALLVANLRTGIEAPWSVPIALALLYLGWRWAGGQAPFPRSECAGQLRRGNSVPRKAMSWALTANAFAIIALGALWMLLHQTTNQHARSGPDFSHYPPALTAVVFITAAAVGAVSEEVGFRGYIQGWLEAAVPWPAAIALMAGCAAPAHALTQGFVWTTFLFYLLADVVYGLTARLTNSIVPGIIGHTGGLLFFFLVVWRTTETQNTMPLTGSARAWAEGITFLIFAALSAWSFLRLSRIAAPSSAASHEK